jgi:ribosomal protein L17
MSKTMAEVKSTKLEKALDFKAKYEALITEAKEEALAAIEEQLTELKKLGLNYELVESGQPKIAKTAKAVGEKQQRVCKICGQPGHNSRTCPQKPAA